MKKKIFNLITLFVILTSVASFAQPVTTDALTFSQTREGYATARATAMGGALASLGADVSSLSYNPAGLAMYRNSEFVFVPQITSVRTNATYGGINNPNSALAKFNATVGGVVHFGRHSQHKFTLGFVYNRLKDFRTQYTINGSDQTSIGSIYANQLNNYPGGINGNTLFNPNATLKYPAQYTNAILAFQSGLVDTLNPANPTSYISKMNGLVNNNTIMNVLGYIDEYAFSGGYSYEDKLFVGFTIGVQNLYYYQTINYLETDNDYNQAGQINELGANGIGVNFKLGVAYKVTNNLRLGFAFHTPTSYSIKQSDAVSIYYNNSKIFTSYPNSWNFSFKTPWKFIAGVSYNILKRLTISADYQATVYNTARFVNYTSPYDLNKGENGITENFQNSSNVRVGLEWNALRWKGISNTNFLFLRGGYNYVQSPFSKFSGGNDLEQYNVYSCGIGYLVGVFFADFAFSYADAKNVLWNLPNQYELDNKNGALLPNNVTVNPKTRTMNFMLTIGFRF